ncbi:aftiphilin isoform X2 [Sceloporus undulatus]|uniref:aftiphilin isoform X2 n=1 Tax=Sceloporus undulatus TaxID=8520 RepID=UPI001C4AC8C2|nr:aftiphilin isoform X2 [Sceloporus undulatus]
MEPDIIRMYSSSPPPLDNGADEEEEEEFGDFGGFSGAGSTSVGFDFTSDYSGSTEEHKTSYNSDYSGKVDNIIAFTTVHYTNDKEGITEFPSSVKGLSDSHKEKCECRDLNTSCDVIPAEVKRTAKPESPYPEIIRTDMKVPSQVQQVDSCNGERQPCSEVLTNGFVTPDTANSQGVEDLDSISDSKGLRTISTHSTELSLDSIASTAEDFADFATFSNKQTTQVEETGNKICKNANEREILSVQENNIINRAGERKSMKEEATSDGSCEYEGETLTEGEQRCISKINLVITDDLKAEEDCTALEHNIASSLQTNVNSTGTTTACEERREPNTGNSKDHILWTSDTACTLMLNVSRDQSLSSLPTKEKVCVPEIVKNGESGKGHTSYSSLREDDFGDFGTVSNGSHVFVDGAQTSAHQEHFQIPNENISKLSSECGNRGNAHQQSTKIAPSPPNEISSTVLEDCNTADAVSNMKVQSPVELENGDDSEFGDFGSVAKKFPDSDDFSDFSSAGCDQGTEWNAFAAEQKESCLWAAFEDEQEVESHSGKDGWPSHRTGSTSDAEHSVSQMTDNVSATSLHGSGSGQLQEFPTSARTVLLNRLERIFEACFPSVPVPDMEEEIAPLNLLLEVGNKPGRIEEASSERELLGVWAELQDIHDAYGLKYQWGGSHSNKKLLCSLGIDTRNILFTGNKKQPFIVPMYAAGLGMLEPTKEPLKPISAAEKIASIGQTPPVSPEMNMCTPDQFQESLPPVQFDWSSSGLTNPLDGVDPELYELTTSKLETSNTTSKVTDAFAKLMSTVEKASSSAKKPKKEEQLSEEAAKVISSLPDLSFMHAKVLMFPATLTPSTSCQGKVD